MLEKFTKPYAADVLPVVIGCIDDSVPRVASHACAALTNFMENYKEDLNAQQIQAISEKLLLLV